MGNETQETVNRVPEKLLSEIIRRIVSIAKPRKIILFGSAAHGQLGPASDLDILRKPDDPAEWMARSKSSFIQAQAKVEGVYLEDLCFNAHQTVEKALKALLLRIAGKFPFPMAE